MYEEKKGNIKLTRFIISPLVFVGAYVVLAIGWSLQNSIAFTTQDNHSFSWGFVIAACIGIIAFFKLD